MHHGPPARRVIHTAQALVDAVVEIPHLPVRGGNVMAPPPKEYAGGAVNILLAAARQGSRCVHAGATGTGPHGDLVRAALAAEGVDVSTLHVPAGHDLGGKGPGEIALSVVAEIVAESYGRSGGPMRG